MDTKVTPAMVRAYYWAASAHYPYHMGDEAVKAGLEAALKARKEELEWLGANSVDVTEEVAFEAWLKEGYNWCLVELQRDALEIWKAACAWQREQGHDGLVQAKQE